MLMLGLCASAKLSASDNVNLGREDEGIAAAVCVDVSDWEPAISDGGCATRIATAGLGAFGNGFGEGT
jgi:hypothetical protein